MSVHYKFKSTLDFDTISFDGLHISVDDLKKAIIHQRRLGKTDFDLLISNAQTKEGKFIYGGKPGGLSWRMEMQWVVVVVVMMVILNRGDRWQNEAG